MSLESPELPPTLEVVVSRIPGEEERTQMTAFYGAAAYAMQRLQELDLGDLTETDEGADLEDWNKLAPTVKDSLDAVRMFVRTIHDCFGSPVEEVDEEIDFDFEATSTTTPVKPKTDRMRGVVGLLHAIAMSLTHDMKDFGKRMQMPAVMGDRWNLYEAVGEFRGKCRAAIGETVFATAQQYATVLKKDVVPFYVDDIKNSLSLRVELGILRRFVTLFAEGLDKDAEVDIARGSIGPVLVALEGFHETLEYRGMRASDKRSLFRAARDLRVLQVEGTTASIRREVDALSKYLESLAILNRREVLQVNDKDVFERTTHLLERAKAELVSGSRVEAARHLTELWDHLVRLKGRSDVLDPLLVVPTIGDEHLEEQWHQAKTMLGMAQRQQ